MRHPLVLIPGDAPAAKQAIVRTALRLFATRGLSATSIRDIANAAGFTNPALYRHFESKDALAEHLFETSYRWLGMRVADRVAAAGSPRARLHALVDGLIEAQADEPLAVLFTNDHLRALWPAMRGRLNPLSLITQTRSIVHDIRLGRPSVISDDIATIALLGTLGQWSRSLHFKTLAGPPCRWREELIAVAEQLVR